MHPRYVSYYEGGMPWELIFLDLKNGAQLMVAIMAFHETKKGTATPFMGQGQPTYQLLSTLRLPSGESVPLNDKLRVEHLEYRNSVGRVPTFWVAVKGIWTQGWKYRMSYPGGTEELPGGKTVKVPGLRPRRHAAARRGAGGRPRQRKHPALRLPGRRQLRRLPGARLRLVGADHPVARPRGPGPVVDRRRPAGGARRSAARRPRRPSGSRATWSPTRARTRRRTSSPIRAARPIPGAPRCEYTTQTPVGLDGYGAEPGGWTVTITPADGGEPRVIRSQGGNELYACGTAKPGDHIVAEAERGLGRLHRQPGDLLLT